MYLLGWRRWRRTKVHGFVWDVVPWRQPVYYGKVTMMCWSHRNTHEGGSKEHRCLSLSACPSVCVRYVYHSDHIFPDLSYQNRVQYLGEPGSKVCSLRINDLRQSDSGTYVFYLITNHSTEKMPEQAGVQLLVAGVNLKWVKISFSSLTMMVCNQQTHRPPIIQKLL